MGGWMDGWMEGLVGLMDGWMDGLVGGLMDGWMDGWMVNDEKQVSQVLGQSEEGGKGLVARSKRQKSNKINQFL